VNNVELEKDCAEVDEKVDMVDGKIDTLVVDIVVDGG